MALSGFFYNEFETWIKQLGKSEDEFETFLKQFLLEQAQRVIADARFRTPVDTGFLRSAYQIGGQEIALLQTEDAEGKMHYAVDTDNTIEDISLIGDNLQVVISNPAEYASYVEYGHHSYQGKYMLTIAVDDVIRAMPQRFAEQFRQFLVSKGVGD